MATSGPMIGKDGAVYVASVAVAEVVDFSYDSTVELQEDTCKQEENKGYQADVKDGSGTVTCHWDPSDTTGQGALTLGATVTLNLYPAGNTVTETVLSGSVIIEKISKTSPLRGICEATFSFRGVLTEGDVSA